MNTQYMIDTMRGKERLAVVFWYYFVLGGMGVAMLIMAAGAGINMLRPSPLIAIVSALVATPIITYQIWILISMWTCAFNAKLRAWGYLTRIYVVILAIGFAEGTFKASQWIFEKAT